MRKNIFGICFLLFVALIILLPIKCANASDMLLPTADNNLSVGLIDASKLVATDSGYMRVFYDGNKIGIEYYDNNFNIQSKKSINMELERWGGFFAGKNAYYVVEGQSNEAEKDDAEVIRVIKYNKNWKKLGAAKITSNPSMFIGGEVGYPFSAGCVEMTEFNGKLYVVTGHRGYVDETLTPKQGHQGFLMIEVDQNSMTGKIVKSDLWHSFAQYIEEKDSYLYVLEQSEGSRCTKLSQYSKEDLKGKSISVLKYGGSRTSPWAVACYASVDDLALSSKNALCLGTSIDQDKYDNVSSEMAHNIYLTVTPIDNFSAESTQIKWLTNYEGEGKSFLGTKITKVNDNRFMISWEEYNTSRTAGDNDTLSQSILHYIFVDGNGDKISKEYTVAAPISDCHPIVKDSKIVYYASNENMVNFYSIDANNGSFSRKLYRVAGENATWKLINGELTIYGTGDISINSEGNHRGPVSSTAGSYSYSSGDNCWKPIREKIEKIVINSGITSIPDNAFNYFSNLKEVEIKEGVKSIGVKAFYSNGNLSKITVPASVTNIGEDFLWTGSYWIGSGSHVVRATICAKSGSYAIEYAKKNDIYYITDIAGAKINAIANQIYTGKDIKPSLVVKDGSTNLTEGVDYTVSYANNKNTGIATATITGIGKYSGTQTKAFRIIPSKVNNVIVKNRYQSAITLSWTQNGGGITAYKVYYYDYNIGKWICAGRTAQTEYNVKGLTAGTTYKFRVMAYKNINETPYYGTYSTTVITSTRPRTPSISELTTNNCEVTVKYNRISRASGYQIAYSTDPNFKSFKTTRIKSSTTASIKGLTKGETYYFKVRAYKTVDNSNIYGYYSKVMEIKVK